MKLSDTSVKIYVVKRNGTTQVELVELEDHIIPTAAAGKSTYALAFNPAENKVQFGLVENGVAIPPSRPTSRWTTLQVPSLLSSLPFPPL